jgi:hypothetical protein
MEITKQKMTKSGFIMKQKNLFPTSFSAVISHYIDNHGQQDGYKNYSWHFTWKHLTAAITTDNLNDILTS